MVKFMTGRICTNDIVGHGQSWMTFVKVKTKQKRKIKTIFFESSKKEEVKSWCQEQQLT